MKKNNEILKFTSYEKKVVIFLFITSIAAVGINIWKKSLEIEYKTCEYAKIDSVFHKSDPLYAKENVEKNVDSEHELLDLRVSDNKYKTNKSKLLAEKSININTATRDMLVSLPGIGFKTADAIIMYRKNNGNFTRLNDLKKVKGIGNKKFSKIEKYINVK